MRKIFVVAMREYQAAVKTKAFILSVCLMPIFMGGSIVIQSLTRDKVEVTDKTFAVIDQTGSLYDHLADAAERRNTSAGEKGIYRESEDGQRTKVKPAFLLEKTDAREDLDQVRLELSKRVRNGDLFGFLIIGPEVVAPGEDPSQRAAVNYYSNTPTYDHFRRWVVGVINDRVEQLRCEQAGLDVKVVKYATAGVGIASLGLVEVDDTGQVTTAKEVNRIASSLIPLGIMMLMFMVVMIAAPPLLQSVLEEKMQRIAEVLLGSVTPFQLMMGKLLGTVGVSLTLATIYLVGAFVSAHQTGYGDFFPQKLIWWFVLFQVLAVLMYGSLFISIGAAVTDIREAQSMMSPVMLVVVSPMFVLGLVLTEPFSKLSLMMSLFPPATPMLMTLRQAVPPGVPLWQPLLGVALVLITTLFFVFAASRIFRIGLLMQGKGATIRQMLGWILRG